MPDAPAVQRETAVAPAGNGRGAALGAVDCLSLAAAPTFAVMALLAGVSGPGPADVLCSNGQDGLNLAGMVPMYALMSAFHLGPWLRLVARRLNAADWG